MDNHVQKICSSIYQARRIRKNITFKNAWENRQALCDAINKSLELTIKLMTTRLPPGGYYNITWLDVFKKYLVDIHDMNITIKLVDKIILDLGRLMRNLIKYRVLPDSESDSDYSIKSNDSYSESDDSNDPNFAVCGSDESDMTVD